MNNIEIESILKQAFLEDGAENDLTSISILGNNNHKKSFYLIAKSDAILCGSGVFIKAVEMFDVSSSIDWNFKDGDRIKSGDILCRGHGYLQELLQCERVALNLLQMMSGVATVTTNYVEAIKDYSTKVVDTRKTIPLLRSLQRYSVRTGGGVNHRYNLSSSIMIKDNHISACDGDVGKAISLARNSNFCGPLTKIEVECENESQLREALEANVDTIMFDNFAAKEISVLMKKYDIKNKRVQTEASGGISLDNIREYAQTGVDFISIGRLTNHLTASDISLEIEF